MDEIKKQIAELQNSFMAYAAQYNKGLGPKLSAVKDGILSVKTAVEKFEAELSAPKQSQ